MNKEKFLEKSTIFSFRMPSILYDKLKFLSDTQGRSMTWYVESLMTHKLSLNDIEDIYYCQKAIIEEQEAKKGMSREEILKYVEL